MVMTALLLALAQPAAAAESVPVCSLVTPGGNVVGFFIGGDDAPDRIRISATPGAVWPGATLVASRNRSGAALRFAMGTDRRGFMLELGSQPAGQTQRSATLFKRERGQVTLPVAFGFCEDRAIDATAAAPSSDPAAIGTDSPAFDPARWPEEDCGLIVSNGRRVRFHFTLTGETQLRLDSPDLWSGRPVSTTIRWQNSGDSAQVGAFGGNGGPEGVQMMFVVTPSAVKLIRFRQLGEPSMPNATGYGICGYRGLTRRPYLQ